MMNLKKFERLLDLYGADLAGWPQAEAAEAEILLQQDSRARDLLAQGQFLDDALDSYNPGPMPESLMRRIRQAVAQMPQARRSVNDNRPQALFGGLLAGMKPRDRHWAGAMALAACVLIMVLAGYAASLRSPNPVASQPASASRMVQMAALPPSDTATIQQAGDSARAVDLFVLAMADPFMAEVEEDILLDTLDGGAETAALENEPPADVELFLQQYFAGMAEEDITP